MVEQSLLLKGEVGGPAVIQEMEGTGVLVV